VKWRVSYLIPAELLTVLDGTVSVCFSRAIWIASAGDVPALELLVLLCRIGSHYPMCGFSVALI
jgi:hypothetical protein